MCTKRALLKKKKEKKVQIYFSSYIELCYESQQKNVDMSRKLFHLNLFLFVYVYYNLHSVFSMSVLKFCIFGHERVESDMCFDKKHEDFFSQVRIDEKW